MLSIPTIIGLDLPRWALWPALFVTGTILYTVLTGLYNLFLHPLRRFPGSFAGRASNLPYALHSLKGGNAFRTQRLHEKYGPVVRIAPNYLSFTDPQAWKDIYGHRTGLPEVTKSNLFYRAVPVLAPHVINSGREEHAMLRRALSHGFSDRSIREQEKLIDHYIDTLVVKLKDAARDADARKLKKIDICKWYNYTTFDVIGDLVFAKSFGCLEGSLYHPFVDVMFKSIRTVNAMTTLNFLGFGFLMRLALLLGGGKYVKRSQQSLWPRVQGRLETKGERPDLFEGLAKRKDEFNISPERLLANASVLVGAGAETTATTLSGITHILLTHPDIMERVKNEVRSTFTAPEQITLTSISGLNYMLACLNEAMRFYPPVQGGLVRVSPEGGMTVAGHFVPEGALIEISHYAINHYPPNWEAHWAFIPERFLRDKDVATPYDNDAIEALQPFSVGPRNCIGKNLAYAEMRLVLARILFEFDMEIAEESKAWMKNQRTYNIWERPPLYVYLTPAKRPDPSMVKIAVEPSPSEPVAKTPFVF